MIEAPLERLNHLRTAASNRQNRRPVFRVNPV